MPEENIHAVFVLPTREDFLQLESGRRPGNVLWREFDGEDELNAYCDGLDAIADAFDDPDRVSVKGASVTVVRGEESIVTDLVSAAAAEAYKTGVEDAIGFNSPLVLDRQNKHFATLSDLGFKEPSASPSP